MGSGRAWAALRYDERREVNKKVHRLWCEEGLRVRVHSPRKRAGMSSIPPVDADAPNVVWAIDFQFEAGIAPLTRLVAAGRNRYWQALEAIGRIRPKWRAMWLVGTPQPP